jgi:REP element-mobilizing transposase RayT
LKSRLVPYLGGIIRAHDGKALIINGPGDHVHILASLAAKHSLSDLMRELKADSSGWIHENIPNQKMFAWQIGYGAFSVSHSNMAEVEKYIANQEEHHRNISFQEEFMVFLKKHEIQYDERFLWE